MLYIIIIIIHAQFNVRHEIVTTYSFKDTNGRTAHPDMTVSTPIKADKRNAQPPHERPDSPVLISARKEDDVILDTPLPKTKVSYK